MVKGQDTGSGMWSARRPGWLFAAAIEPRGRQPEDMRGPRWLKLALEGNMNAGRSSPPRLAAALLRCCMLSSVGSLTTRTGTSGHLFPKMSMSTSRMPEYGTSAPLTARSVRKACCSERSCRWAAAHVSVTVVTSLPVSSSAATSCPLMRIVVVGHLPISPVVFLPPVARLMEATGVRSFPVAAIRLLWSPFLTDSAAWVTVLFYVPPGHYMYSSAVYAFK